jgi:hypothetical protein
MAGADDVIEAIFEKVAADADAAVLADPLRELWQGGRWEAEEIVKTLKQIQAP